MECGVDDHASMNEELPLRRAAIPISLLRRIRRFARVG
jgi:hypothetical protein